MRESFSADRNLTFCLRSLLERFYSHTRASVTKQYNLVPAERRRCSATVKLTANSGKVPLGLLASFVCSQTL